MSEGRFVSHILANRLNRSVKFRCAWQVHRHSLWTSTAENINVFHLSIIDQTTNESGSKETARSSDENSFAFETSQALEQIQHADG